MISLNFNLQSLHIWCKWSCISKILELSLNQEIWKINSFNRESKGRSLRSYRHFLHLTTTSLPVPPPYLPYWCKIFLFHNPNISLLATIQKVVMNTFWHYALDWIKCVLFRDPARSHIIIFVGLLMIILYENMSKYDSHCCTAMQFLMIWIELIQFEIL